MQAHAENVAVEGQKVAKPKITLWPSTLVDYLSRRLAKSFTIRAFTLDPAQVQAPLNGQARTIAASRVAQPRG